MSISMSFPRYCDLYNGPDESCECHKICGTHHDNYPQDNSIDFELPEGSSNVVQSTTDEFKEESIILEEDRDYNKFIDTVFYLSNPTLTDAIEQYCEGLQEICFNKEDEENVDEFRKIVDSSKGEAEEVEEALARYCLDPMGRALLVAAKKYRMIVQWYERKLEVDENILRDFVDIACESRSRGE
jgi:hypothetical protein